MHSQIKACDWSDHSPPRFIKNKQTTPQQTNKQNQKGTLKKQNKKETVPIPPPHPTPSTYSIGSFNKDNENEIQDLQCAGSVDVIKFRFCRPIKSLAVLGTFAHYTLSRYGMGSYAHLVHLMGCWLSLYYYYYYYYYYYFFFIL